MAQKYMSQAVAENGGRGTLNRQLFPRAETTVSIGKANRGTLLDGPMHGKSVGNHYSKLLSRCGNGC
jgi:hypothetical protein